MSTNAKRQHGGRRPGAGRKRIDQPMERYTVRLDAERLAAARQLGDGDLSAGIRAAIDAATGAIGASGKRGSKS